MNGSSTVTCTRILQELAETNLQFPRIRFLNPGTSPVLGGGFGLSTDTFLRHDDQEWHSRLYRTVTTADGEQALSDIRARAIPYFTWGNLDPDAMRVW